MCSEQHAPHRDLLCRKCSPSSGNTSAVLAKASQPQQGGTSIAVPPEACICPKNPSPQPVSSLLSDLVFSLWTYPSKL